MSPRFEPDPRSDRHGESGRDDVPDRLFDRLVDGELSEHEYRRLLESLDETPGGWRRCALAFLENQALQRDVKSLSQVAPACRAGATAPTTASTTASTKSPIAAPTGKPHSAPRTWTAIPWLAVAASWIALFGAGWQWSARRQEARFTPTPNEVTSRVSTPKPAADAAIVGSPAMTNDPLGAWQWNGVRTEERPLQSEFAEQLREKGHDWRVREHYIPVQLGDGRRLVMPVRELNVAPVRNVPY